MSWLLFYLLAALHPVAFVLIGWMSRSWRVRLVLWALLPIPATVYCWDYFVIQSEHERMCSAEAGFRVLMQPEKTDRVRYVGEYFRGSDAQDDFRKYFPSVKVVEVPTEAHDSRGRRLPRYDSHTASVNPNEGRPMQNYPFKEPPYAVTVTPIDSLDTSVYEIRIQMSSGPHYTREDTLLSKNGTIYVSHTGFVHQWGGIRYPDAVPTWRCNGSPPPGQPWTTPKDDRNYEHPLSELNRLIFNQPTP